METAELAVSKDLLRQLAQLPPKVLKKVFELVDGFEHDSKSAARHLEPIHQFRDKRARTARVGDDYRAIIVAPEQGNRYLLVYVDHHDEAMRWARNKVFNIHPVTGSLQVFDVEAATAAVPAPSAKASAKEAFGQFADDQLVQLGVPEPLLPSVRRVRDDAGLMRLAPHLPEEASEALTWLLAGDSFDEVKAVVSASKKHKVDTADFGTALNDLNTQRRFVRIRSALELEEMFSRDVDEWRIFLHPDQRRIVTHDFAGGAARVLGGPGTGKTVVAMHRAKFLVDNFFKDTDDRVLFTTFSKSLAQDIKRNLRKLCGGADHPRIEVTHLHSWSARWLREQGIGVRIANEEDRRQAWSDATGITGLGRFTLAFVKAEWDRVVQAQNVTDEVGYLRVSRKGCGGGLLKKTDRQFLWSVFSAYREQLQQKGSQEFVDVVRMARQKLETSGAPPYRAVVVDETQDFGPEELKLLRALAPSGPNDLFLVGDSYQRIYAVPVRLSACGIDIVGRGKRLRVNYRTTHEIREYALQLFGSGQRDDLDGGLDSLRGYTSVLSGPDPQEEWFADEAAERKAMVAHVRRLSERAKPESLGVLAPTRAEVRACVDTLRKAGVAALALDEKEELPDDPGVRVCTMHRAKGLEFHHVVVCGLGDDRFPRSIRPELADDDLAVEEQLAREKSLLLVACTRARETLLLSGWGKRAATSTPAK
jgi:hypothetical protein